MKKLRGGNMATAEFWTNENCLKELSKNYNVNVIDTDADKNIFIQVVVEDEELLSFLLNEVEE